MARAGPPKRPPLRPRETGSILLWGWSGGMLEGSDMGDSMADEGDPRQVDDPFLKMLAWQREQDRLGFFRVKVGLLILAAIATLSLWGA